MEWNVVEWSGMGRNVTQLTVQGVLEANEVFFDGM